ncbi:cytokine receptor-like [Planococcus citri]|uniref:cytokine receptor-like n=1 Tax=Planococcus citri TaxID=170843 RepID=UPI0031FA4838
MRLRSISNYWWLFMKLSLAIGLTSCVSSSNQKSVAGKGMISPPCMLPADPEAEADIVLEIGTPLEILCTLELKDTNSWNHTSKDLRFKEGDRMIDNEHVTFVNSTTARLYVENSRITVKKKIFYCMLSWSDSSRGGNLTFEATDSSLKTSSINETETRMEQLICSNSVLIGSKPKKAVNFKCLGYNWETLDCWWHEPSNGIKTDYSIHYSVPKEAGSDNGQVYACPTDQSEPGHCQWSKNTSPPYRENFEFVDFYINGNNKFGKITQMSKWHHYDHVVLAQPSNLTSFNATPHSVYLQWHTGSSNVSNIRVDLLYRVEYKQSSSKLWNVIYFHSKDVEKEDALVRVNLTGIKYPNMKYEFFVYVKLSLSKINPWSKAASLLVKTSPCAPYQSPKTDTGGFEIYAERSNYRNMMIYWKQIPAEEYNGDNFEYQITVFENDIKVDIKPISMNNFSAKFSNLSFNAYKFYIKSVNEIGSAPRSSIVHVPSKNDILHTPYVYNLIRFGDNVYEITVLSDLQNLDESEHYQVKATNFTLFWCKSSHGDPYPCTNFFTWIHLPVDILWSNYAFKYNLTTEQNIGYQFAVSTNSLNSSSGIEWILCTGIYKQVNKIQNVWIGKVGSNFVDVRWKLECANHVEGFQGYNISYYSISENHQQDNVNPAGDYLEYYAGTSKPNTEIFNLLPNTTYKISVAIFTAELLGPPSEWVYARTRNLP